MTDSFVTAALSAAVATGRAHGLPTDAPSVLATGSNVLVGLGPVVARVPATTRLLRADPAAWLDREVRLARHLADRGAPVVPPSTDPPPGPHLVSGLPVTFWRYVRHDPGRLPSPATVGRSLAELHEALRDYPGALPAEGPVAELRRMLDLLADDLGETVAVLRAQLTALAETVAGAGERRPLHGDAHPANLLATEAGWRWIDLEDTWRGPVAWDLAVLWGTARLDGAAALAAYPGAPDPAELAPYVRLRRLFGICWRFVVARRFPGEAAGARSALSGYLAAGRDPGP
ncbi:aminoglycoside phosphotransferase family protein [Prauserella shujinwangii]|uniref:phosphotransferase n=1 Tax=Prauserella shujinwangii TaxID=1453103 RepID=UPI001FE359FB|nr:aminoglycoside phosphotransferase family protein [Prauserella shujinwangii]